jgi:hypothetical protein
MRPSPAHRVACRTAGALLVLAAAPLAAQTGTGSTLRGRITSQAGQPLAGALVIRSFIRADTVRADSAGRYLVERLPRGRHVFQIKHPGFEMIELDLTLPGDTVLDVDIPLQPLAGAATAPGGTLDRVGFNRRRAEVQGRRTRVVFLGPDEIAARGVTRVTQLFEGLPDVRVRPEGTWSVVFGDGGRCRMRILIDGFEEPSTRFLDELLTVDAIAAVEVYPIPSQVPREFQTSSQVSRANDFDTRTMDCGALLFWRR